MPNSRNSKWKMKLRLGLSLFDSTGMNDNSRSGIRPKQRHRVRYL